MPIGLITNMQRYGGLVLTCKSLKIYLLILFSASLLLACGESDAPQEQSTAPATEVPVVNAEQEESMEIVYLPSQVVYQEDIYKNWPYTDAPVMNETIADVSQKADQAIASVKEQAQAALDEMKTPAEEQVAAVVAPASDKPYQLIDGKISANAIEGWKTYNGGGCGVCHGKGGIGAVGPSLGKSVTTKLSKEDFVKIVTNGKPGSLMRGNKTNKRVMDNMDNLYAYLVARGDDTLGPENLIKFPLGKNE